MLISGQNSCISCLIHSFSKINEIFIDVDKKHLFSKLIDKYNANNKTSYIKINDLKKRKGFNDIKIHDAIYILRENYSPSPLAEIIKKNNENSLIIIADQLTDQNNIGNIVRTALLMGADGLIIPEHSSAQMTGATSNTSSGAIEILKFHISKNLGRTLEELKKQSYWIYSLDMGGELLDAEFKIDKRAVIIVGNEGNGIRKNILEKSDFIVSIPQLRIEGVDSYNAANSIAIAAHHYKLNIK